MKKVLISLMCIIMVVCFMSTVAMAEVGEDAVAKIGEQSYSTLEEAINAARNNDEIVLLKDASGNGVSVDGASGRTFTIDFAGHTYTIVGPTLAGSEGTKSQCFQLLKGSTITMKNGSIVADNEGLAMIIQNYCNLTLEDSKW